MLVITAGPKDTAWETYSGWYFVGCAATIVPGVLVNSIMSSRTAALWANGGKVVREVLDTCVIRVDSVGVTYLYSVDTRRGVIMGYYKQSLAEQIFQQYLYGYSDGIYYLRKLSNSQTDTTIAQGGYWFHDIRVNGKPVSISCFPGAPAPRRTFFRADTRGRATLTIAGNGAARVSLYDLLSRAIFTAELVPGTHLLDLDLMCRSAACASGRLLLRVEEAGATPYSTLIVR